MKVTVAVVSAALVVAGMAPSCDPPPDPKIAVGGDIACAPSDSSFNNLDGTATKCRMKYTADLLVAGNYASVLAVGDLQYNSGKLSDFNGSYEPTWGRVKSVTRPAVGNHEYGTSGAGDYFTYFGAAAGTPGQGWYSYDLGAWHVVVLNSNCTKVSGGCGPGSPQAEWLKDDLAAHAGAKCTLAAFHHARYSSGHDGDNTFTSTLFKDLYDANADVVLSGHSHDYERFAPQDNARHLDNARGIRQFVVGTGGAFFTGFGSTHPNSEARQNNTYGILELTLHDESYDWRFVSESGKTYTDSGTSACH